MYNDPVNPNNSTRITRTMDQKTRDALPALARNFLALRQENPRWAAVEVVKKARELTNAGKTGYPNNRGWDRAGAPFLIGYHRHNTNVATSGTPCQWFENAGAVAAFVGHCDKVATDQGRYRAIDHNGWYLEDEGFDGETARGVVYKLPHGRYLAGIVTSYDEGRGAILSREIYTADNDEDAQFEAALAADKLAEIYAENERDYRRISQARSRWEDIATEIKETRRELLKFLRECKAVRKALCGNDSIIATLKGHVNSALASIADNREERAKLFKDFGSDVPDSVWMTSY
jgi:hypothetical protein